MKLINPLFILTGQEKLDNYKIESSVNEISPISKKEMVKCELMTVDNKTVPVFVDFENRVCLPVRKEELNV